MSRTKDALMRNLWLEGYFENVGAYRRIPERIRRQNPVNNTHALIFVTVDTKLLIRRIRPKCDQGIGGLEAKKLANRLIRFHVSAENQKSLNRTDPNSVALYEKTKLEWHLLQKDILRLSRRLNLDLATTYRGLFIAKVAEGTDPENPDVSPLSENELTIYDLRRVEE